jgi:arabinogalactan oligomer/maltooligosaccharide transport system permease protein
VIGPALLVAQVVLWHAYHGAEQQGLEQAVQVWNRAHPEQPVTPVAVPIEGYQQKLQAAIPRGHGPDAFVKAHEVLGEWAAQGLVAPIPPGTVEPGAFLAGTVEPLRVDGKLYGVPLAFKSLALYYRTDLIARPPRTTDELRETCRTFVKFTATQQSRFCLAYEAGSFYHHAAWLHGFGGSIFSDRAEERPFLATPEGIAALDFVRGLATDHVIPDEIGGAAVGELFNDGRAAMVLNGPWFTGEIRPGVPFAVAPIPAVPTRNMVDRLITGNPALDAPGTPSAPLRTIEAGMLSPRAKEPEAALAFLAWLAGPEGARIRARVGRQPVCAFAAWSDPEIARDAVLTAFRDQLAATVPMSNRPAMRAVWEPAQLALRRVLRGAAEPEAALREADRRIAIALRPPPAPAARRPWMVAIGLLLVGGAASLLQRSRRILRRSTPGSARAWAWLGPAVAAMAVLVFVPFAVGAAMSLAHFDGTSWRFVGLANFRDILGSRDQPLTDPLSFYFTLVVTALWTVANVSLHVAIGVALALALRDPLLRLRGVYRVLLIVPWAVPNYITALIWKGMFHRQFGAVNAMLGALGLEPVSWFARFWTAFTANLATNVWLGFPFMMVTALGALSRIPRELEEAAALDGADRLARLRHVMLPLLRPAMLPAVVLGAVWTFNMFNVVFLVSGGEPDGATDILVSQAYRFAFTRGHQYGYAAAYAVLIFAVLVGQNLLARRVSPAGDEE